MPRDEFDPEIFKEDAVYRFETLANRFREMAFVTSGVFLRLRDERPSTPREMSFYFEGGVWGTIQKIGSKIKARATKPGKAVSGETAGSSKS